MPEMTGMGLLERRASLALLAEHADEARRGKGRLVLVAGEAGVGKSALVECFRQDLDWARWSWGACDGLFTPRPLEPLFDIADQLGGALLELCQTAGGRHALFRALLHQVSEPGVLDVLIIEDIHWADEATLDLLRFMGRRLGDAPVLLIATYRDDAIVAGDPLSMVLGDLARQRSTRRIELAPLSMDAVGVLAEGSGLEASELFRLTGGNPFFLSEVLQAGAGKVPVSARDAALARTARLGARSRSVLDVAALIGARVELELLASISGCSPSMVDALLACGLLVGDDRWLRFRHEIARLAVEQAIPSHRSGTIHAQILDALISSGCGDDARMAFHAEGAGDGVGVLRYAPAAARAAADLASHREAAAQLERALRFAAEADTPMVAGLYDGLADELALVGRWPEAAQACERALELWRELGDRLREGDTLRRLSLIVWSLCRGDEALGVAAAAVSALEPLGPSIELARAYARSATLRMLSSQHATAADLAVRAQQIAERLDAFDALSDALITQATCAAYQGGDWIPLMRRALEIALFWGFQEEAGRAYANFCGLHVDFRQFAEAARYLVEGLAYCDEHDLTSYAAFLRSRQAELLECTGKWEESLALHAKLLAGGGAPPINQFCALTGIGLIRARQGESDIWEYLDGADAAADGAGEPLRMAHTRLARAEARWLEGKLDEAAREAERAYDAAASCAWMRGAAAVWLARSGSPRLPADDVAEPYRLELDGEWNQAAQYWTELDCPYDAAMALTGASDETLLREAFATFNSLNALPATRIIREKMRQIGARSIPAQSRATTRAHPFGLTKREQEVLALICAEYNNAQIAIKLHIQIKTVERHVTSILAKMGVPNRTSAAQQAIQLVLHT
jgi:DNA-binding CsgD family transcriptional regulator